MNQTQVKYARNRAEAIYNDKYRSLSKQFTDEGHQLSDSEKLVALQEGKFSILTENSDNDRYYGRGWASKVLFDEERTRTVDKEGLVAAQKSLTQRYTTIVDQLVLGDNEEALQLLAEFERS